MSPSFPSCIGLIRTSHWFWNNSRSSERDPAFLESFDDQVSNTWSSTVFLGLLNLLHLFGRHPPHGPAPTANREIRGMYERDR